jgi:GNAT superfamily N-acetyltransferase
VDVYLIDAPDAFANLAAEFMAEEPFSTNVIGVQLLAARDGSRSQPEDAVWIAVHEDERVVGLGMHTPPYRPFLSRLPRGGGSAIASALLARGRSVTGVSGESRAVAEFVGAWTEKTGVISVTDVAMRMYRLCALTDPSAPSGSSRPAEPSDQELLLRWFEDFQREAQPHAPASGVAEVVIWRMAGVSRIGPVYTPPNLRRRGFGAAVTAAATRAALAGGATHVVLYTDLANPVSNAIYQRLGYVPDHDAEERRFVDPAAGEPAAAEAVAVETALERGIAAPGGASSAAR